MQKFSSDLLHSKQVCIVTPYADGLERFLEISSTVALNIWSQSSPAFISLHRVGLVSNWARWGLIGISIPAAFTASGNLAGLAVAMQTMGVLSSERCLRIKQRIVCNLATASLRTADVFPVVASLPTKIVIFRRERSDDRRYVCSSQAGPQPAGSDFNVPAPCAAEWTAGLSWFTKSEKQPTKRKNKKISN